VIVSDVVPAPFKTLAESLRDGVVAAFDLEYTSWEGTWQRHWSGPGEYREIIQIGAVKLDRRTNADVGQLSLVVKPTLNPTLSAYVTALTGVTQRDVDTRGVAFPRALQEFAAFTADCDAIVSWGGDEMTLAENCGLNRVSCPIPQLKFHSVRSVVCDRLIIPYATASSELPAVLGLAPTGPKHDALSDARAVAGALRLFADSH
jgi:inhibitor of KinA sporulation pathway (predicted exonuclease)